MRVGIIGTGGMGTLHAKHLAQSGFHTLAAVMDVDRDRATLIALDQPGTAVFTDAIELIHSDGVEAVIVASPDATHASLAIECLKASKPVLVEKPLAADLGEALEVVIQEAELGRRLIQVGFMRHYDPAHLEIRDALKQGLVGTPLFFRGWHRSPRPDPPMSRRSVLVNAAVHDIQSARWLFGREPVEVYAIGPDANRGLDELTGLEVLCMTMQGGGVAVIEADMDTYAYEVGVEITGTKGIVSTGLPSASILRTDAATHQNVDSSWRTRFVPAYRNEVSQWLSEVAQGRQTGPTAWDGYATLAAAAAAVESVLRRAPVSVRTAARPTIYQDANQAPGPA